MIVVEARVHKGLRVWGRVCVTTALRRGISPHIIALSVVLPVDPLSTDRLYSLPHLAGWRRPLRRRHIALHIDSSLKVLSRELVCICDVSIDLAAKIALTNGWNISACLAWWLPGFLRLAPLVNAIIHFLSWGPSPLVHYPVLKLASSLAHFILQIMSCNLLHLRLLHIKIFQIEF